MTNIHEKLTSLLIKWVTALWSTKSFIWNPEIVVKLTSDWGDSGSDHEMLKCLHSSSWNRPKEVQWCNQLYFYFKMIDSCHMVTPVTRLRETIHFVIYFWNSMFCVISIVYLLSMNTLLHFKWQKNMILNSKSITFLPHMAAGTSSSVVAWMLNNWLKNTT